jgi:hypothetical protein
MDISPAFARSQRLGREDPKMSSTPRPLESRIHSVLSELPLQSQEVLKSVAVIGVDRDPFAALSAWVDGIQADRNLPFEMSSDDGCRQFAPVIRPVVVTLATFVVRDRHLNRVFASINEELVIVGDRVLRRGKLT